MSNKSNHPTFIAAPIDEQVRPYKYGTIGGGAIGFILAWLFIREVFVYEHPSSATTWLTAWGTLASWWIAYRCSKRWVEIDPGGN